MLGDDGALWRTREPPTAASASSPTAASCAGAAAPAAGVSFERGPTATRGDEYGGGYGGGGGRAELGALARPTGGGGGGAHGGGIAMALSARGDEVRESQIYFY